MRMLAYLLARFSEPSSYAGLGALLALAGWHLSDGTIGEIAQFLAAFCALLALGLKDRGLLRALLIVGALLPALTACGGVPAAVVGGLGSAGSAYMALDKLGEAASPYLAKGCAEYTKAKAAADATVAAGILPDIAAVRIAAIESFGDAACAHPPSGDPLSTAIWFGRLAGQIGTLASAGK